MEGADERDEAPATTPILHVLDGDDRGHRRAAALNDEARPTMPHRPENVGEFPLGASHADPLWFLATFCH